MKIIDTVLDLIFPPRCVICDEVLPFGTKHICKRCIPKVVYIKEPYCLKCGKALTDDEEYCLDCRRRKHIFIQGSAVFDYGSVADSLFRFKNKGRAGYASFYALKMYETKKDWLRMIAPDALIPVPIHKTKLRKRGYNQAELVSRELSKLSGIPTVTDFVTRVKATVPLKDLGHTERQNSLKKAFKVTPNDVKLSTIVIIDDIYTTGSTIDAIAGAVLKVCNATKIYFLTVTVGRGV